MEGQYSIKDLENLSGIHAHTIRIWEKRFGVLKPVRSNNNFRHYNDDDLRYFLKLAFLNKNGFKISKLASFSIKEIDEHVSELQRPINVDEVQIDALIMAMTAFDEEKAEETIQHLILHMGLDEAMIKVIFPFLNRVGTLWSTGCISLVQEHFISNLIRQKIIFATSSISPNYRKTADETFILFTFPDDHHDIGLLFTNYLIRLNGFKTIYLGNSVPVEELERLQQTINAKYIFTQSITHKSAKVLKSGIKCIRRIFTDSDILLGGNFEPHVIKEMDENTKYFNDFESFISFLSKLRIK